MIILDTNVLSESMLERPDPRVIAWMNSLPASSVWLTSITIFEIRFGISRLPTGRKKNRLQQAFESAIADEFGNRVLPFDHNAANAAGELAAHCENTGDNRDLPDIQIAAIASTRNATLATRNTKHFANALLPLSLIDPWSL